MVSLHTSRHVHTHIEFLIVCFDIIVLISLILQMFYALYCRSSVVFSIVLSIINVDHQ